MTYSIETHKHRLAAWASSTAARASNLCRFKVEKGVAILEAIGFTDEFANPDLLPTPEQIDEVHFEWRNHLIQKANANGITFTHGVAAKLLNTYLKVRFVCGGHHQHPKVAALHPPIDKLLLDMLANKKVGGYQKQWRKFSKIGWSKYSSEEYQMVIDYFRKVLENRPMWVIEEFWQGYQ